MSEADNLRAELEIAQAHGRVTDAERIQKLLDALGAPAKAAETRKAAAEAKPEPAAARAEPPRGRAVRPREKT